MRRGDLHRRALAAVLLAVLLGVPLLARPAAAARTGEGALPVAAELPSTHQRGMRFVVRFTPESSLAERAQAVASVGGIVDADLAALGLVRLAVAGDAADAYGDGPAVAIALARDPAVASAEFDRSLQLTYAPNDAYYATDPFVGLGQWGIRRAAVDRAWDVVRGSPAITVAVIDTGVDAGHPDLQGSLLPGRTMLSLPSATCTPNASARDDNGHGTHVTGVIAATADNGIGIAGVAYGVRVLPLKALDCTGTGLLSDIAQAITYATDSGARIVSVSLGSTAESPTLRSALQYATARNTLIFAAAGNCGQGGGSCTAINEVSYPAAYPEAIAVAATDVDDTRAFFSTAGAYVTLAAPGRRILSTVPTYPTTLGAVGYAAFSGTSQATPFAAAVAALVWSREPSLTAAAVRQRLISTVDDLGPPGPDLSFGAGRVNAYRAVTTTSLPAATAGVTYSLGGVPRTAAAGGTFQASVVLLNTSSFTWSRTISPVRITYQWLDAAGQVVQGGPLSLLPADVPSGGSVAVPLTVQAPAATGTLTLRIDLVQDGAGAFSARGAPPGLVTVTLGRGGAFGATYSVPAAAQTVTLGVPARIDVQLQNTGGLVWPAGGAQPVTLSYHWIDRSGAVSVWDGIRTRLPRDVAPGETLIVGAQVVPPPAAGLYTLRFDLVHEGDAWFSGLGVAPRDLATAVQSGWAATYSVAFPPALLPGGRATVPVTVRNDGTFTWMAGGPAPVHLAAHVVDVTGATALWDGERAILPNDLAPGQSATVNVPIAAPLAGGVYRARVDLVQEGVAWASGQGVPAGEAPFAVLEDYRAALAGGPLTVSRAAPLVAVTVTNLGGATWTPTGAAPVGLAAHWLDAAGNLLVWDGPRGTLPRPVAPGETVTVGVPLGLVPPGGAAVVIDLISEGVRWFGAGVARPVTLVP